MALATALASRLTSLSPTQLQSGDTQSTSSSHGSASSSPLRRAITKPFDARSCHSDATVASASDLIQSVGVRPNEHLAVLLPKHLWKPDSQATKCDRFVCRKPFSILFRKHHCRKCGSVICSECSARTTLLLDTSNLEFLNPPRNVPITAFASPTSPVVDGRVCNDCWDQIHGTTRARAAAVARHTAPIAVHWDTDSASSSASNSPRSPPTPLDGSAIIIPQPRTPSSLRRSCTSPRIPTSPLRSSTSTPIRAQTILPPMPDVHISDSELEAYPLRYASAICKANGGGRWMPKPVPQIVGYRVPGTKAQYELDLEAEAEQERLRKLNPVFKDGDFQLRSPRELEPHSLAGPYQLCTF